MVTKMLNDKGADADQIAEICTDFVNRHSLHSIRPKVWLNVKLINFEMTLLNQNNVDRGECYVFKIIFINKLLEEGTSAIFRM